MSCPFARCEKLWHGKMDPMNTSVNSNRPCIAPKWISAIFFLAPLVAIMATAGALDAADTLVYSFEPDLEGFDANGGLTVSQDTIGATEGSHSMKVSIPSAGFSGARGNILHPAIGDPPGMDHVLFDLTMETPYPDAGTFAVVGLQVFCVTQPGENQIAVQIQTEGDQEVRFEDLPAGTYRDMKIDLTNLAHPVTGAFPVTFNDIVGTAGSGENDIIPTGFQLYFNKNAGPATPWTFYIDNIRVGMTEAAIEGDYNGNGTVDAADYTVWRDNLGLTGGATPDVGDGTGDGNVTSEDYEYWKARFGNPPGSGGGSVSAVPEPSSAILNFVAATCWWGLKRRRAAL